MSISLWGINSLVDKTYYPTSMVGVQISTLDFWPPSNEKGKVVSVLALCGCVSWQLRLPVNSCKHSTSTGVLSYRSWG